MHLQYQHDACHERTHLPLHVCDVPGIVDDDNYIVNDNTIR